jgi:hypothetical protein
VFEQRGAPARDDYEIRKARHADACAEALRHALLAYVQFRERLIRVLVGFHDLVREGDDSGPDVFGRHWPMVGERIELLPPQLLRVGVQFADGRTATNIGGQDRPVGARSCGRCEVAGVEVA